MAIVSVLTCGAARADAPAPPSSAGQAMAVAEVVLGIISYTTWPTPHAPLRLCVLGHPRDAEAPLLNGSRIGTLRVRAEPMSLDDPELGADCDVVYAGALTGRQFTRLRAGVQGHDVLTISEDDAACSGIIMFCLTTSGTKVLFSVNLDSVAHSGVEVNPQVLLLGRHPAVTP
jgi:hypothetical protein